MKSPVTTIYVVRHGQSESNAHAHLIHTIDINQVYGEAGSPLTQEGREQTEEMADKLKHVNFDDFLASDMLRSRQTAEIVAGKYNLPVKIYRELREREFGKAYDKLAKAERLALEEGLYDLPNAERLHRKFFPDSESVSEATARLMQFFRDIVPGYAGKTIFVVTHGNIMRLVLIALGLVAQYKDLPSGSVKNCSYFVLETDGETFEITQVYNINKVKQTQFAGTEE